jgi:hypothetical protein
VGIFTGVGRPFIRQMRGEVGQVPSMAGVEGDSMLSV